MQKSNTRKKSYLILYFSIIIYSFVPVLTKMASSHAFLSKEYCFFMFSALAITAIFAFLWQKTLKNFSLLTAYMNKSIQIIISMSLGAIFFSEAITWNMVLGSVIIIFGIFVMRKGKHE